jgi:hypothetical protein
MELKSRQSLRYPFFHERQEILSSLFKEKIDIIYKIIAKINKPQARKLASDIIETCFHRMYCRNRRFFQRVGLHVYILNTVDAKK